MFEKLFGKKEDQVAANDNNEVVVAANDNSLKGITVNNVAPSQEAIQQVPAEQVEENPDVAAALASIKEDIPLDVSNLPIQNSEPILATEKAPAGSKMQTLDELKATQSSGVKMTSNIPTADNDNVLVKDGNTPNWAKRGTETAVAAETPTGKNMTDATEEVADTLSSKSRDLEIQTIDNTRRNFVPAPNSGEPLDEVVAAAQEKISDKKATDIISSVVEATAPDSAPVLKAEPVAAPETKKVTVATVDTIEKVVEKGGVNDNKPEIASSTPEREALREAVRRATEPKGGEDLQKAA